MARVRGGPVDSQRKAQAVRARWQRARNKRQRSAQAQSEEGRQYAMVTRTAAVYATGDGARRRQRNGEPVRCQRARARASQQRVRQP